MTELSQFPFSDNEFDLALCSHLLFTYSDLLSLEFHLEAIAELLRVARNVAISEIPHQMGILSQFKGFTATGSGLNKRLERFHCSLHYRMGGYH